MQSLAAACAVLVLLAARGADARAGGLGANPIMGWNTWCTQNKCGVDWCTSDEVLNVAQHIKDSGMQAAGYNYINLDDCWGVRNNKTHQIEGDPLRFPEGMKAFIAKIHQLGFKFGLYTDWGAKACHFPFTGSFPYFEQDAKTFADWEVDLVKLDGCNVPAGHTGEDLAANMSAAMAGSGRDMWLNFHCWHTDTCAKYGNSFRVAADHHDEWSSTSDVMQTLIKRQPFWGPNPEYGWPDLDFVYTGGEGCGDHSPPGVRCPGQSNDEYISEFTIWAIASGQLLIAVDPRNMSDFQRQVWFNREVIAMYNDTSGFRNVKDIGAEEDLAPRRLSTHLAGSGCSIALEHQTSSAKCVLGQSFDCYDGNNSMWTNNGCRGIFTCNGADNVKCDIDGDGLHVCPCKSAPPTPAIVFARPLATGAVAVALHNTFDAKRNLTVDFSKIPARNWSNKTLQVRDMWAHENLGQATGKYTAASVPPHGTVLVSLSE